MKFFSKLLFLFVLLSHHAYSAPMMIAIVIANQKKCKAAQQKRAQEPISQEQTCENAIKYIEAARIEKTFFQEVNTLSLSMKDITNSKIKSEKTSLKNYWNLKNSILNEKIKQKPEQREQIFQEFYTEMEEYFDSNLAFEYYIEISAFVEAYIKILQRTKNKLKSYHNFYDLSNGFLAPQKNNAITYWSSIKKEASKLETLLLQIEDSVHKKRRQHEVLDNQYKSAKRLPQYIFDRLNGI